MEVLTSGSGCCAPYCLLALSNQALNHQIVPCSRFTIGSLLIDLCFWDWKRPKPENHYVFGPQKSYIGPRGNANQEISSRNVARLLQKKKGLVARDCLDDAFNYEVLAWCVCPQTNFTLPCNYHSAKIWHLVFNSDLLKPERVSFSFWKGNSEKL